MTQMKDSVLLSYTDEIQNVTPIKDSMFCMLQNTDERQHATQMKDSMLPYYTDQRQNVTMTHR